MDWRDYCIEEIAKHRCFVSALHKKRFIEMFDMVQDEPFFTKEVCKCLFLAAWERKYTDEIESVLQEMIDKNAMDTQILINRARNKVVSPYEAEIYKLERNFLENPGETPDESCLMKLSAAWIPLGDCALQVSEILDRL